MSYDNNMTGIISKNDRKTEDKHPDIRGQCEIDGVQYWVAGWRKERKDGSGSFYSLRFEEKEQQQSAPAPSKAPAPAGGGSGFDDMEDSIPF